MKRRIAIVVAIGVMAEVAAGAALADPPSVNGERAGDRLQVRRLGHRA